MTVLNFGQISVNISKMVHDRDILSMEDYSRKSYVAYRMAPVLSTLNDLEGHSPVAGLFKCNPSNICSAFYQISTDSVLAPTLSDSWASCPDIRTLRTLYVCASSLPAMRRPPVGSVAIVATTTPVQSVSLHPGSQHSHLFKISQEIHLQRM